MLRGYWVVKRKQRWGSDATLRLQAGATGLVLTRSCALWGLGTGLETGLDWGLLSGLGSAFLSSDTETDNDCR